MAIRAKTAAKRCHTCRLHFAICICDYLPRLETRTRVALIMHPFEGYKTTNTGRLAMACLANGETVIHGGPTHRAATLPVAPGSRPLLLFPDPDAESLADFVDVAEPMTLIVPDGTWRQASKLVKRVPDLAEVARVHLPVGPTSRYRLRKAPREGGVATMEAIARALGVLEGPHVQATLEAVFETMIERILWMKGRIPADAVSGGLGAPNFPTVSLGD